MVNVKGTRNIRAAVELLCEKAGITDKDIDGLLASKRKAAAPKKAEKKPAPKKAEKKPAPKKAEKKPAPKKAEKK